MMKMINDDDDDDDDGDNRNEARAGQWDDVECNKNLTFVCRLKTSICAVGHVRYQNLEMRCKRIEHV